MTDTEDTEPGLGVFNRKADYLNKLGLSQLHHYVGPDNVPELQAVHRDAYPTAIFYLSTILGLYFCGLLVILIHYMNSSYGKWAWTIHDVWDELRPSFFKGTNQQQQTPDKGVSDEDKNAICDDEEECHLHQKKPKKVGRKKNLARRLSYKFRKNQADVEEPLNCDTGDAMQTTLSTSQRNTSCACQPNTTAKIEVVSVEVVINQQDKKMKTSTIC